MVRKSFIRKFIDKRINDNLIDKMMFFIIVLITPLAFIFGCWLAFYVSGLFGI